MCFPTHLYRSIYYILQKGLPKHDDEAERPGPAWLMGKLRPDKDPDLFRSETRLSGQGWRAGEGTGQMLMRMDVRTGQVGFGTSYSSSIGMLEDTVWWESARFCVFSRTPIQFSPKTGG